MGIFCDVPDCVHMIASGNKAKNTTTTITTTEHQNKFIPWYKIWFNVIQPLNFKKISTKFCYCCFDLIAGASAIGNV